MRKLSFVLIAVFAATLCRAAETDSLFVIQGSKGRLATHLQFPSIGNNEKVPIVIICHGLIDLVFNCKGRYNSRGYNLFNELFVNIEHRNPDDGYCPFR